MTGIASKTKKTAPRQVILVTGLSGAGISSVLKTLEDAGYQAIDNLPLSMLLPLLDVPEGADQPVAVAIDSRAWDFSVERFAAIASQLQQDRALNVRLLFVDCGDTQLLTRFMETRRRHPLALDRAVVDGIKAERALLDPLRDVVDEVIDTSETAIPDLKRLVAGRYALEAGHKMLIFVTSFGFKKGVPRDADMIFDMRFLENPHYVPHLRPKTGQNKGVQAYIDKDPDFKTFIANLKTLLTPLLPRYAGEGKSYLGIAIGCTGGKHRSVYTAETLFKWLDSEGYSVAIRHRDMPVGTEDAAPQAPKK